MGIIAPSSSAIRRNNSSMTASELVADRRPTAFAAAHRNPELVV